MHDLLIERIRKRATDRFRATDGADVIPPVVHPVVSPAEIAKAQEMLGFALPVLLAELYLRVGNGGFGPGYGLIGLAGGAVDDQGEDLVELYAKFVAADASDPLWRWPQRLLPVAHLGCGMYACVDCTTPEGAVTWFEPNPHATGEPWDDSFILLAASMAHWLEGWLADKDLCESAFKAKFGEDAWHPG